MSLTVKYSGAMVPKFRTGTRRNGSRYKHPITPRGQVYKGKELEIRKIPHREHKLIVFDYDGTLSGKSIEDISEIFRRYKSRGFKIAVMSRSMTKPRVRKKIKEAGADIISTAKNKIPILKRLGKEFSEKIYVGDLQLDKKRAEQAGYQYRKPLK